MLHSMRSSSTKLLAIHSLVEVDASYVKPFKTDTLLIAPGQTTNALLTADKTSG